jgi:hypothetical protein
VVEEQEDMGASPTGDRATAVEPVPVSPLRDGIPSASRQTGRIILGRLGTPLRNGSHEVVLRWEARLLPARECEGGGWYSAHPTKRVWQVWYAPEHKSAQPRFDKVASFHATDDLDAQLSEIAAREMQRYGFTRQAQAIETRRAETREAGFGAKHESAVGNADAPKDSGHADTKGEAK